MEYLVQGIIIVAQDFKDTDKLYTIFSLERGLIRALAKSVRKSQSKLAGWLMPGNQVRLMLANGSGLNKIAQVQVLASQAHLSTNYAHFILFNQIAEILSLSLKENDPEPELWQDTVAWLRDLDSDLSLAQQKVLQLLLLSQTLHYLGFHPRPWPSAFKFNQLLSLSSTNNYLKNREIMLKLEQSPKDLHLWKAWLRDYWQAVLERKLNTFKNEK